MKKTTRALMKHAGLFTSTLAAFGLLFILPTRADGETVKTIFKAMSDYLAAQEELSFNTDTSLEIVTGDGQKLAITVQAH